jgi:Zn-finger nucleic acid-binding protein
MVEEDYEGVGVKRCVFCGGVLVRWRKLVRIGIRTEKGFDDRVKKVAELAERDREARLTEYKTRTDSPLSCPKCGRGMHRSEYSGVYPVVVDKCLMCSLVWFEKDELETFQYMLETKGVIPDGWD